MNAKKILKIAACACLAGALSAGGLALSGCGWTTETWEGEYQYTNYGVNYGVKVSVEVQSDEKGDRIRKVTVVDSGYTEVSDAMNTWTEENRQNYFNNLQTLLNTYRGMYVADVLAIEVPVNSAGEPIADDYPDSAPVISGATQSSARLLLAVQDALKNCGYTVESGEYQYTSWGTNYGVKVKVFLKDDTIVRVVIVDSDYVEVSAAMGDWTEEDRQNYFDNRQTLLDSYAGRSVSEILAATVTFEEDYQTGQPGPVPGGVSDSSLLITGATQCSGRLLLAVQNALANLSN